MRNSFFQFKQFTIQQDRCAMKVTTDACLFGAWTSQEMKTGNIKAKHVLDIGSGTGLLPLMIAQKNSTIKIDAIEIDQQAYKQAQENVAGSPFAERINMLQGNGKTFHFARKYDCIISNPPFFENELRSENTKRNIALHSEELLLDALLRIIKQRLTPEGWFFILMSYNRNNEIGKLIEQHELTMNQKTFVRQSVNHDYFRIMISGTHQKATQPDVSTNEISICNDKQEYTEAFIELLKDYYLHL